QIPEDMRINEDETGTIAPEGETSAQASASATQESQDQEAKTEEEVKGIAYIKIVHTPDQPNQQLFVVEGETERVYEAPLVSTLGDKAKEDLLIKLADELRLEYEEKFLQDSSQSFTVMSKKMIV